MPDSPLSILYVDDESLNLIATKEYLTSQGFIVDTAQSGSEALLKITEHQYDAIISDYQMPGMDGIGLVKEIRSRGLDTPFLLFTGRGREEVVIEAIDSGADFYVQKGGGQASQFKELIHKIRIAAQKVRDSRALQKSELRFRSLIQNSSDIIRILDRDGIIRFDSPSSAKILGYPEGSLIGRSAFDFIHPEDRERVWSDFQDVCYNRNNHEPTEYRLKKEDGTYLYVESVALSLLDNPEIQGIVTTTHPIHSLKMAEFRMKKVTDDLAAAYEELASNEEELRVSFEMLKEQELALSESESKFRNMAERSSDLIILIDKNFLPVYISPSAPSIIGYELDDFVGKPASYWAQTIFSPMGPEFLNYAHRTMKGESFSNLELKIRKKDGSLAYISGSAVPTVHEGIVTGIQISIRDITQVKTAELALRESEEKFRRFASNARDLIFRMSLPDENYEYISPALEQLTGYTPEEFYENPALFSTLIHPDFTEYVEKQKRDLRSGQVPATYEFRITDRSGNTRWLNQRNVLVTDSQGTPVALEGIVTEVTIQKNTELKLRRSEHRFLATTINAGFWVWEVDADGTYTYSSPAVEAILGLKPEEIVGKIRFFELFEPSVLEEQIEDAKKLFGSQKPFSDFINLNQHKNGKTIILKTSGTPVFDEQGTFTGYCGVDQDITTEKEAEEKIRESEARYRLLADNVHDVIWTTDERMRITYISPSVTELLGYTPSEMQNLRFKNILSSQSYERIVSHHYLWMEQLMDNKRVPDKTVVELEFIRKDKTRVCTEIMIRPVYSGDIFSGFVGAGRDITRRKHTERALKVANHQLSLLTSVTRHDILNKVSVIFSYLSLAELEYLSPKTADYLRIITMATEDIQSNIEFTRVYQDLGSQEPMWFILDSVMPRSVPPVSIHYTTELHQFSLYGDPMLEKVFFNLLDNSIRHGESVSDIQVSAHDSEQGLIITWEDNGTGIPFEQKEEIFERGVGKNTGFGLFLVREILLLTGITIQETGVPGKGARFEIKVPKGVYRIIS